MSASRRQTKTGLFLAWCAPSHQMGRHSPLGLVAVVTCTGTVTAEREISSGSTPGLRIFHDHFGPVGLPGVHGFQIRESGERFVGRDIDAAFGLGDPPCLDRASAALL